MQSISLPLVGGPGLLFVLFGVALFMPRLARAAHLPDLVGLIIGGVLIGPHVLGVVERSGSIAVLGTAGLLYLMFQAGLELDPTDFAAHRKGALTFGAWTFTVPFVLGTVVHLMLGFSTLAALLLGSCWASHTLVAYPVFQRARAVSNRAVSIGVGGTVVTDTAALLLLVALARAYEGDLRVFPLLVQLVVLVLAGALIMVGLPRAAAWFFAGIGHDRSARFLFVMVGLYGSAMLAEVAGVEPIIGAFLAGLALNRQVIEGSELAFRIHSFGSTFLVPVFLVSVGMLIDPLAALSDGRTVLLALSFTAVVLVGKSGAAAITGRVYQLEPGERMALIALSVPQAAATLAAVFVGFEIGLLEQSTVDAVVIVILVTCLAGSWLADRAIDNLPEAPTRATLIGRRILVPMPEATMSVQEIEFAAALGRRDSGTILPLSVLDLGATALDVKALQQRMVATVEDAALSHGCEATTIVRLDLTPAAGIMHAAIEHSASMVVLPWDGRRTGASDRFSHVADTVLDISNVPVVITRAGDLDQYSQVVLRLTAHDLQPSSRATTEFAWVVGSRLAEHRRIPLTLLTDADDVTLQGAASITGHVSAIRKVESLGHANMPVDPHELVISPISVTTIVDHRTTICVALPRSATRTIVEGSGSAPAPHERELAPATSSDSAPTRC